MQEYASVSAPRQLVFCCSETFLDSRKGASSKFPTGLIMQGLPRADRVLAEKEDIKKKTSLFKLLKVETETWDAGTKGSLRLHSWTTRVAPWTIPRKSSGKAALA